MKWIPNFILYYVIFILGAGLIVAAIFIGKNNNITAVNSTKRQARKAYMKADYKDAFKELKFLVDSLQFTKDEARLDLAHSGYLASRFDSTGNVARDATKNGTPTDTAALKKMVGENTYSSAVENYGRVSESEKFRLASIAYNQLGITTYAARNVEEEGKEDEALLEAVNYFKSALKKDPENEFARYNYELLRKRIQYPDIVMNQVRSLVHQRKYREARQVLHEALGRDSRMQKNYSDYVQRLENVISIDSLSRS